MAAADFLAALPEVSLVYSPTSGTTPPTVYFTNTSQYAISPAWAFGDGSYGSRTISRTLTT